MKNFTKILCTFMLAAVTTLIIVIGCDEDGNDGPVFGAGTYTGTYTVIRDYPTSTDAKVDTMSFQFLKGTNADTLIMEHDPDFDNERQFCDYVCEWQFVIDSLKIDTLNESVDLCVSAENPEQTYYYFVEGNKFVFTKFDMDLYPPLNENIYRKIELWIE